MSLTIATDVTLTTGTIARRFGDFSMQIDMAGTAKTADMKLSSLPTIKQEFDLQGDLETVDELYVNLSEIEFSVFDRLDDDDGSSLFEIVDALSLSDAIRIQITTPNGTDYFLGTKSDIKWDWRRRELTFKANAALRYDTEVTGYSVFSKKFSVYDNNTAGSTDMVFSRDVLRGFLETQGSSPNTVIIGHTWDYDFNNNETGAVETPALGFVYSDIDTYSEAQDFVAKMAVSEGAFFGVMNGYAFYVRRNYNTDTTIDGEATTVTISASQLRDYGLSFYNKSIRTYKFQLNFTAVNGQNDNFYTTASQIIDENGIQDIDILYNFGGAGDPLDDAIYHIKYDVSDSRWEVPDALTDPATYDALDEDAIGADAEDSYKRALGIEQPYKVSFEIFGINTLKPFQFITFDTDVVAPLDGAKVRPSSLEYNLEEDVIIGEGYFI